MIKLLLADDQDVFRSSLASLLSSEPDIEVIGEVSDGKDAIAFVEKQQPDVILMDVEMPIYNGIIATEEIMQRFPWIKILVLTNFNNHDYIAQSIQVGAKGYLAKEKPADEMATAIRAVNQGYFQLSPKAASFALSGSRSRKPANNTAIESLQPREREILQLIGQGKNNTEISDVLFLSSGTGTVRNYYFNKLKLMDKDA